jgi:hypothetical protein
MRAPKGFTDGSSIKYQLITSSKLGNVRGQSTLELLYLELVLPS